MAQPLFDSITPSHFGWGLVFHALGLNVYQALAASIIKTFIIEQALKNMAHEQFTMFPVNNELLHCVADQATMLAGFNVANLLHTKRSREMIAGGIIMSASWASRGVESVKGVQNAS